jgi:hypothetical protein
VGKEAGSERAGEWGGRLDGFSDCAKCACVYKGAGERWGWGGGGGVEGALVGFAADG